MRLTLERDEQQRRWLAEYRRYRNACGCKEGAIAAIAALAATGVWLAGSPGPLSLVALARACGALVASVVIGGATGKIAGLALARARFLRNTRHLDVTPETMTVPTRTAR